MKNSLEHYRPLQESLDALRLRHPGLFSESSSTDGLLWQVGKFFRLLAMPERELTPDPKLVDAAGLARNVIQAPLKALSAEAGAQTGDHKKWLECLSRDLSDLKHAISTFSSHPSEIDFIIHPSTPVETDRDKSFLKERTERLLDALQRAPEILEAARSVLSLCEGIRRKGDVALENFFEIFRKDIAFKSGVEAWQDVESIMGTLAALGDDMQRVSDGPNITHGVMAAHGEEFKGWVSRFSDKQDAPMESDFAPRNGQNRADEPDPPRGSWRG